MPLKLWRQRIEAGAKGWACIIVGPNKEQVIETVRSVDWNVDIKYGSNETNLKDLDCKVVNGDICDYELMAELVKGVDAIVNFAAETHVDRSISNIIMGLTNSR